MNSYFFPLDLCCHLGISKIFDWKPIIHHMPFFFTPSALISLFLLGVGNCLGIACLLCIAWNSSFLGTLTKRTFFLKIGFLKVPCLCEFWNISSKDIFLEFPIIRFQWCCCVCFLCKSIFVSLGSSCSVILLFQTRKSGQRSHFSAMSNSQLSVFWLAFLFRKKCRCLFFRFFVLPKGLRTLSLKSQQCPTMICL